MALEVDRRAQFPEVQQPEKEILTSAGLGQGGGIAASGQPSYARDDETTGRSKRIFGFRATTFILGVALIIVTILAIVAAAVGGSLAAKRNHL